MRSNQGHSFQNLALVVDSDASVRMSLDYLFGVVCRRNVQTMPNCIESLKVLACETVPEIVVVGCFGPNNGHLEMIRAAAALTPRPMVIAVDHDGTPENGVRAFLAGADEVVRLPFSLMEFALRLKGRMDAVGKAYEFDFGADEDWDAEAHVAQQAGLTSAEAQVLRVLIRRDGKTVSREELSRAIDNRSWSYGDRKFDVHVGKIRKKLKTSFADKISVSSIRSVGYRLTMNESEFSFWKNNQE
jgi:two-component system, OmpR family, response regulator